MILLAVLYTIARRVPCNGPLVYDMCISVEIIEGSMHGYEQLISYKEIIVSRCKQSYFPVMDHFLRCLVPPELTSKIMS